MSNPSRESLYDLIYSALGFADNLFELWLTVTFAAILAAYFTAEHMSRYMRALMIGLYGMACILLIGRWLNAMFQILSYYREIESLGYLPFPNPSYAPVMGVIHLLTYIIASIATLYFMKTHRAKESDA